MNERFASSHLSLCGGGARCVMSTEAVESSESGVDRKLAGYGVLRENRQDVACYRRQTGLKSLTEDRT